MTGMTRLGFTGDATGHATPTRPCECGHPFSDHAIDGSRVPCMTYVSPGPAALDDDGYATTAMFASCGCEGYRPRSSP